MEVGMLEFGAKSKSEPQNTISKVIFMTNTGNNYINNTSRDTCIWLYLPYFAMLERSMFLVSCLTEMAVFWAESNQFLTQVEVHTKCQLDRWINTRNPLPKVIICVLVADTNEECQTVERSLNAASAKVIQTCQWVNDSQNLGSMINNGQR
jgi:sugar diacid utilization regulator